MAAQYKDSTAKDYYAPLTIPELAKLWNDAGGPWRWSADGYAHLGTWSVDLDRGGKQVLVALDEDGETYPGAEADCRFVAAAANAIMPLILRIEELEARP